MDLSAIEGGSGEGRVFASGSRRGSLDVGRAAEAGAGDRRAGVNQCLRDSVDTLEDGKKAGASAHHRRASLQIAAGGARAPAAQARLAAAAFDVPDRYLPVPLSANDMFACCHGAVCLSVVARH